MPVDQLPHELIMEIASYLLPTDQLNLMGASKGLRLLLTDQNLWRKNLQTYFPLAVRYLDATQLMAFQIFTSEYNREYRNVSAEVVELFELMKSNNFAVLDKKLTHTKLFSEINADGLTLANWAHIHNREKMLDFLYEKYLTIALPAEGENVSFDNINKDFFRDEYPLSTGERDVPNFPLNNVTWARTKAKPEWLKKLYDYSVRRQAFLRDKVGFDNFTNHTEQQMKMLFNQSIDEPLQGDSYDAIKNGFEMALLSDNLEYVEHFIALIRPHILRYRRKYIEVLGVSPLENQFYSDDEFILICAVRANCFNYFNKHFETIDFDLNKPGLIRSIYKAAIYASYEMFMSVKDHIPFPEKQLLNLLVYAKNTYKVKEFFEMSEKSVDVELREHLVEGRASRVFSGLYRLKVGFFAGQQSEPMLCARNVGSDYSNLKSN